jgi:hypothetical protein
LAQGYVSRHPLKIVRNGRKNPRMSSDTFYKMPSDLQALIGELNHAERMHHISTESAILAPSVGPCGKAAQLLRDFDMHRWLAADDLSKAKLEIRRLRVLLGHMPGLNEPVEIAYKGDLEVRQVGKDRTSPENSVEWKPSRVDILWSVGVHDTPGFSIKGSTFIHTPEGFGSTWRFPLK